MIRKIVISMTLLQLAVDVYGQKTIPVDLVKLSKITLAESPIVKQNILTISSAEGGVNIQKSTFDYQLITGVSLSHNALNLFEADPRNEFINNQLNSRRTGALIGLQKTFRSSLIANFNVDYTMASDNFPFNSFSQNVGVTSKIIRFRVHFL